MAFWTNNIEIKRSFRYIARIYLFENDFDSAAEPEPSDQTGPYPFLVHSFTKPEFGFATTEIKDTKGPHRRVIAGSGKWGPVEINIYDVADSRYNFSKEFYDWLSKLGYQSGQESTANDWVNAAKAIKKIQRGNRLGIFLEHIDSNGKKIEEWTFNDPVIKAISFGDTLSYESDSPVIVKLGVEISSAKYLYVGEGR